MKNIFITLLILYLLLAFYIALSEWPSRLILFPSTNPISLEGSGLENRFVNVEGKKVQIVCAIKKEAKATVLHFVGNASRAELDALGLKDWWYDFPVSVCSANYPGYGLSEGNADLKKIPKAVLTVFDELAKDGPVIVSGNSIGTSAALYIASKREVAGVFLVNPPPLHNLVLGEHGYWNAWLLAFPVACGIPLQLNSLLNAPKVKAPAVFISASHDEIVPVKYQRLIFNAYSGSKQIVTSEGGHNDEISKEKVYASLQWLWKESGIQ